MPDHPWFLPFTGSPVVPCAADDPDKGFTDGQGQAWKPRPKRRLVQPDDPNERGAPTIQWRTGPPRQLGRDVLLLTVKVDPLGLPR